MYFSDNLNFKSYKLNYLNKSFFQDLFFDFNEISSLSKDEREKVIKSYEEEIVELKNTKSYKSISLHAKKFEPKITDELLNLSKYLHIKPQILKIDKESNTHKILFELYDGLKIESVLMRFEDGRNSVCVSSQVGCPVGCIFCASGKMGFYRNLTSHEIVDQVIFWSRFLKSLNKDTETKYFSKINHSNDFERVTNIVYMGMGEPMLNLENVIDSVKIFTDPSQFGLGDRHITVSSSGYIPQLEKYMEAGMKTRLAISLHAPNQSIRQQLMPVAKVYSLDKLMDFCKKYEKFSHKRISYEYTMIDGINDDLDSARDLVRLLRRRDAHVNLIPLNPIANNNLRKSSYDNIMSFFDVLQKYKIPTTIRITMGDKIQAACGQLANEN